MGDAADELTSCEESCVLTSGKCCCLEDMGAVAEGGETKLGGAARHEDEDFFKGWPVPLRGSEMELAESLFRAVDDGDVHCAREVLSRGRRVVALVANARRVSRGSETPFCAAAALGDVDMLRALVEGGCCLNCRTTSNATAVHVAALMGRPRAVQFLLSIGFDAFVHAANCDGEVLIDEVLTEMRHERSDTGAEQPSGHFSGLEDVAQLLLNAGACPWRGGAPASLAALLTSPYDHGDGERGSRSGCGGEVHDEDKSCDVDGAADVCSALRVTIPPANRAAIEGASLAIASPPSTSVSPTKRRFSNTHRVLSGTTSSFLS